MWPIVRSNAVALLLAAGLAAAPAAAIYIRLLKDASVRLFTHPLPADKARVGNFGDRITVSPRFTNNQNELIRWLWTELEAGGPTPVRGAVHVGMTSLGHVDGRRVVLVFTDGYDASAREFVTLHDVISRAQSEEFMVYGIGLWMRSGRSARRAGRRMSRNAADGVRVTLRLTLAAMLAAALLAAHARAQQPAAPQEPTFRAGTRTVPIYATVTDEIGRFVLDLRRDEFEVRDDGKVQPITLFTTDVQPLAAIVLLDGSRSMVKALDTVITAADHLVVRLMPGDRARVGSFSDEIRFEPAFTADRDQLAREVNDLFDLRIGAGTRLWDAVGQATTSFEGAEGRRVVIVFTDGDDTASTSTYDDALAKARRADVMVYVVLIRGMERLPEERRQPRRYRPQDASDFALASGGGYYYVNNVLDDMNSIATAIAEELHSQYVLGFVPHVLDGKLHKLEVRVKRPRLKIRARQSYVADEQGVPQ